jgi:hypothetical protein
MVRSQRIGTRRRPAVRNLGVGANGGAAFFDGPLLFPAAFKSRESAASFHDAMPVLDRKSRQLLKKSATDAAANIAHAFAKRCS